MPSSNHVSGPTQDHGRHNPHGPRMVNRWTYLCTTACMHVESQGVGRWVGEIKHVIAGVPSPAYSLTATHTDRRCLPKIKTKRMPSAIEKNRLRGKINFFPKKKKICTPINSKARMTKNMERNKCNMKNWQDYNIASSLCPARTNRLVLVAPVRKTPHVKMNPFDQSKAHHQATRLAPLMRHAMAACAHVCCTCMHACRSKIGGGKGRGAMPSSNRRCQARHKIMGDTTHNREPPPPAR